MSMTGNGLARLLQVGGALSRGPRMDRLQLPRLIPRRDRWDRDEAGLFRWSATARRGSPETGGGHGPERASNGFAA